MLHDRAMSEVTREKRLLNVLGESIQRRQAASDKLESEKAGIPGEDINAAVHHLFATNNYLVSIQGEDLHVLQSLIDYVLGLDEVELPPDLRLVTDDDTSH